MRRLIRPSIFHERSIPMSDSTPIHVDAGAGVPPFAALFDDPRPGAWCRAHEVLTPRNAARLWAAATHLADALDEDLGDVEAHIPLHGSEWGRLPWLVSLDLVGPDWCGQFIDAAVTLADDLAGGRCPVPRCTAEEVALQFVLEDVVEPDDEVSVRLPGSCRGLPTREHDGEWEGLAVALFPYPKVRRLIADGFAGITDDYELVAETGLVRLAVYNWFGPFGEAPTRPVAACDCKDLP
jgi:hypothetical protein